MAAENDFFLRFGTNADDFAGEVDAGVEAAIQSVERLGQAVEGLSQKLKSSTGGDLIQGLRGDLRNISQTMATTFGTELRSALMQILPESLRGMQISVQPNVQTGGASNISSTPPSVSSSSAAPSTEMAAIFKTEMRGVAKIMATTISDELKTALSTSLPEVIRRSIDAAPRTPQTAPVTDAGRRPPPEPRTSPFGTNDPRGRALNTMFERDLSPALQDLVRGVSELSKSVLRDINARKAESGDSLAGGGTRSGTTDGGDRLRGTADQVGRAQSQAAKLDKALDEVSRAATEGGAALSESVSAAGSEIDELRGQFQALQNLIARLMQKDPSATLEAQEAIATGRARTSEGGGGGTVGLDPETVASFTQAATDQMRAANTFTNAVNSFGEQLPTLRAILENVKVTGTAPRDTAPGAQPDISEATAPVTTAVRQPEPDPQLTSDVRRIFDSLEGARAGTIPPGDVGQALASTGPAVANVASVMGEDATNQMIGKMIESGASFDSVIASFADKLFQLEQVVETGTAETRRVAQANSQLAGTLDSTKGAVQTGVDAGLLAPDPRIAGPSTAEANASSRQATARSRELQGLLTGRTPEGVSDISQFDDRGTADVLADSVESGLDRASVLARAAQDMNLQEPMRSLVQNVTDEMVATARDELRKADQSAAPRLNQGTEPRRTSPIASVFTAADDPRVQNLERITNAAQLRRATTNAGGERSLEEQLTSRSDVVPSTDRARQGFNELLDRFFEVLRVAVPAERATELENRVRQAQEGLQPGDSRAGVFQALEQPFAEVQAEAGRLDDVLRQTLSSGEFDQYRDLSRLPAGNEPGGFDSAIQTLNSRIERLGSIMDTRMSTGGGMGTGEIVIPQGTLRPMQIFDRVEGADGGASVADPRGDALGRDATRAGLSQNMQIVNAAELKTQALAQAVAQRAVDLNASVEELDKINAETNADKEVLARVRILLEQFDANIVDRVSEIANQAGVANTPSSSIIGDVPGLNQADIDVRNQAANRMAEREAADRAARDRIASRVQASGRNLVVRRDAQGRAAGTEWSDGRFDLGGASPTQMRRSGLRSMAERVVIPQEAGGDGRTLAFLRNMADRGEQPQYMRPVRQDDVMDRFRDAPQAGREIINAFNVLADRIVRLNEQVLLRGEAESTLEALRQTEAVQPLDDRDLGDRRAAERVMTQTQSASDELGAALNLMYQQPDPVQDQERFRAQRGQSVSELVYGQAGSRSFAADDAADVPPIQYAREAGMAARRTALMRRYEDQGDFGGLDATNYQDISGIDERLAAAMNPQDIEAGRQALAAELTNAVNMAESAFQREEQARQAIVDVLQRDGAAIEKALASLTRSLQGATDAPATENIQAPGPYRNAEERARLLLNDPARENQARLARLQPIADTQPQLSRMARGAGTEQDVQAALGVFASGDDPLASLRGLQSDMLGPGGDSPEAELLQQRLRRIYERGAQLEAKIEETTARINELGSMDPSTDGLIQDRTNAQLELRDTVTPALTDVQAEISRLSGARQQREQELPGLTAVSQLSDPQLLEALTNPAGLRDRPEIVQALEEASRAGVGELTEARRQEQALVGRVGEDAGLGLGQAQRQGITTMEGLFQALNRLTDASSRAGDAVSRLPAVEEGFTRLYRGASGEQRPDGTVDSGPTADFRGRYFTPDEEYARNFAQQSGGDLSYVDVPTDTLNQIRSGDTPEAAYMALKEATEGSSEVVLPQDWVEKAQQVSTVLESIPQKILAQEQVTGGAGQAGRLRGALGGRTGIQIPNAESERLSLFDYLSGDSNNALPGAGGKDLLNTNVGTVMSKAQEYVGKTAQELGVAQSTYTRVLNQLATLAGDTQFSVTDPTTGDQRQVQGLNFASEDQLKRMGEDPRLSKERVITPELITVAEESRAAALTNLSQDKDIAGARERSIEGNTNKLLIDVLGKLEASLARLGDCCEGMKRVVGEGGPGGPNDMLREPRGIQRADAAALRQMLQGELGQSVAQAIADGSPEQAAMEIMADPNLGQALSRSQINQAVSFLSQEQTGRRVTRDQQRGIDSTVLQAERIRGMGGQAAFDAFRGPDDTRVQGTGEALVRATGDVDASMTELVRAFRLPSDEADQLRARLEALQQTLQDTGQSAQQLEEAEKARLATERSMETDEARALRESRGYAISPLYDPSADPQENALALGREQLNQNPDQRVDSLLGNLDKAYGGLEGSTLRYIDAELRKEQATLQGTAAMQESAIAENKRRDALAKINAALPEQMQQRLASGEISVRDATNYLDQRSGRSSQASVPVQRGLEGIIADEDIGPTAQRQVDTYVDTVVAGMEQAKTPVQRTMMALFGGNGSVLQNVTRTAGNFIARYMGGALVFGFASQMREMLSSALETEQTYIRITGALEATSRSTDGVRERLQNIAIDTNVAVNDTYEVMAQLAGVFETTEETLEATKVVNQLELISQGALSAREGFRALSAVTAAFQEELEGRGMTDLEAIDYVADLATRIQDLTGVNIEDTTEGLARLGETASTLGIEMELIASAIALTAKATGQTGQGASEQIGRILSQFQSADAQDLLVGLGVTDQETVLLGDFNQVMQDLFENYASLNNVQQRQIANTLGDPRQFALTNALLNQGSTALDTYREAQNASGAAGERQAAILSTLRGQLGTLGKQIETFVQALVEMGALNVFGALIWGASALLTPLVELLQLAQSLKESSPFASWIVDAGMLIVGLRIAGAALKGMLADAGRMLGSEGSMSSVGQMLNNRRAARAARPAPEPRAGRRTLDEVFRSGGQSAARRTRQVLDPLERYAGGRGDRNWRESFGDGFRGRRPTEAVGEATSAVDDMPVNNEFELAAKRRAQAEAAAARATEASTAATAAGIPVKNADTGADAASIPVTAAKTRADVAAGWWANRRAQLDALATRTAAQAAAAQRGTIASAVALSRALAAAALAATANAASNIGGTAATLGAAAGRGVAGAARGAGALAGRAMGALMGPMGLVALALAVPMVVSAFKKGTQEIIDSVEVMAESRQNRLEAMRTQNESGDTDDTLVAQTNVERSREANQSAGNRIGESMRYLGSNPLQALGTVASFANPIGLIDGLFGNNDGANDASNAIAGFLPDDIQGDIDNVTQQILDARNNGDLEGARELELSLLELWEEHAGNLPTASQNAEFQSQLVQREDLQRAVVDAIVQAESDIVTTYDYTQNQINQLVNTFQYLQGIDAQAMAKYGAAIQTIISTTADLPDEAEALLGGMTRPGVSYSGFLNAQDQALSAAYDQQLLEIDQIGAEGDPEKLKSANEALRGIVNQRAQVDQLILQQLTDVPLRQADISARLGNTAEAQRYLQTAADQWGVRAADAQSGSPEEMEAIVGRLDALQQAAEMSIADEVFSYELLSIRSNDPMTEIANNIQIAMLRMEAYATTPGMAEEVQNQMKEIAQLQQSLVDEQNGLADAMATYAISQMGNPLERAAAEYADAMRVYNRAVDSGAGAQAIIEAAQAANDAARAQREAAEEYRAAGVRLSIAQMPTGATLSRAMAELSEVYANQRNVIREFGRNSAEYRDSAVDVIESQQAIEEEIRGIVGAQFSVALALANAAGLNVEATRIELAQARDEFDRAMSDAGGDENAASVKEAYAGVLAAEAAMRDRVLEEALGTIDFMLDMEDITANEAIAAITEIMNTMDLTEDQTRDLRRRIKQLQEGIADSLSGGFNIADVRLPTPYEVRRSLGVDGITEGVAAGQKAIQDAFDSASEITGGSGSGSGSTLDAILGEDLAGEVRNVGNGVDDLLPSISEIPGVITATLGARDALVAQAQRQLDQLVSLEEAQNASTQQLGAVVSLPLNLIQDNTARMAELEATAATLMETGNAYLEGTVTGIQGTNGWLELANSTLGEILGVVREDRLEEWMNEPGQIASSKRYQAQADYYQGRWTGGAVAPYQTYKVGEYGEELFVPNTAGTIVNANDLNAMRNSYTGGSSTVVNQTFETSVSVVAETNANPDQIARAVERRVTESMRRSMNANQSTPHLVRMR